MSEEILQNLKEGNVRFMDQAPRSRKVLPKELKNGQSPHTIVVTCADSRVPPELIFDQDLGELFVIRVAGNTSTSEVIGSAEYAAAHLGSSVLMVLGHTSCGAVGAAISKRLDGEALPTAALDSVVEPIFPAVDNCKDEPRDELTDTVVKENVAIQLKKLKESSILSEAESKGNLRMIGAVYDLGSGKVNLI